MDWIGPITVESGTQFYFTNRNRVEIFRRINGEQQKLEFDVATGNPIGGEAEVIGPNGIPAMVNMDVGAVLVDIEQRLDVQGEAFFVMIYVDDEGNVHERVRGADADDPERERLEAEVRNGYDYPLRPTGNQQDFGDDDFGGPPPGFDF